MKHVLITGVSTGIGYASAKDLIEHGFHVFGSVRRRDDADRVQRELGPSFTPLLFDVTDGKAVRSAAGLVQEMVRDEGLFGLVNNAGICLMGPLMHMPERQIRDHFEINVFGLLDVTRAFLPLLGASRDARHPPGRIVNLSSVSGRIAYPFLGAYAASKFAVEALSDSLRRELLIYGIDVILIEPGAVRTPIWDKGLELDMPQYATSDYADILKTFHDDLSGQRDDALPVETVSRVIRRALTRRRPKTRYVIPNSPLTRWWIPHWLPDRWLDFVVGRHLGYPQAMRHMRDATADGVNKSS